MKVWKPKSKRKDTGRKRTETVQKRQMRERDEILVSLVMILTELRK
jgi:hypothetical protein